MPGDAGDPSAGLPAPPLAPGDKARLTADGLAVAPEGAPEAVKQIIAAGNKIAKLPYKWGGGHGRWEDSGYDCSGSVSYALRGAGLLKSPLASYDYFDWGQAGKGQWVTIYTNSGHMYMTVAGLRFDTSGRSGNGSRWQKAMRDSERVHDPPPGGALARPPGGTGSACGSRSVLRRGRAGRALRWLRARLARRRSSRAPMPGRVARRGRRTASARASRSRSRSSASSRLRAWLRASCAIGAHDRPAARRDALLLRLAQR